MQEILPERVRQPVLICIWSGLGFSVDDKYLKRAGLDYWDKVNISYYDSFKELIEKHVTVFSFMLQQKLSILMQM